MVDVVDVKVAHEPVVLWKRPEKEVTLLNEELLHPRVNVAIEFDESVRRRIDARDDPVSVETLLMDATNEDQAMVLEQNSFITCGPLNEGPNSQ